VSGSLIVIRVSPEGASVEPIALGPETSVSGVIIHFDFDPVEVVEPPAPSQPAPVFVQVSVHNLRVRRGPGVNYAKGGVFTKGKVYRVFEQVETSEPRPALWVRLSEDDQPPVWGAFRFGSSTFMRWA
jgi:hypothetical protein